MKKLLALLLSVIMAVSLAVPAFAAESDEAPVDGDPGFWLENGEPVPVYTPGDAIPINAFLPEAAGDSSFGIIGGADGPTSIITTIPVDLGELDLDSVNSEILQSLDVEQYLADHPGLEEQLKANAYDYFAEEYGGYWTAEEYMEFSGLAEEEFLDAMVWDQAWELACQEVEQKSKDWQKEALGGVAGQVGVMVNGAYVQFPDAAPELTGGRTMVPVRALVETLGGEVSYEDGVVLFVLDEWAYEFEIGSTTVTVRAYDTGIDTPLGTIDMDCAPYIKDGRTYVPIRFISEALGYDVGWDDGFETAILLDRDALAAEIDEDFTILNRVQAARTPALEEGKSLRADFRGNVAFTAFDTLNGNTTYQADLNGKTLVNTEAANGTYSVTLSDSTIDKLMELIIGSSWSAYADEEEVALLRSVLEGLTDMEFIMNREGLMWVHAPFLDELSGEDDVWCGYDVGAELGELMFTETDGATIGSVLASMVSGNSVTEWLAVDSMVETMVQVYGDEQFTTSGGTSTLVIDADTLDPDGSLGVKDAYKEYELTMKVDSRGGATVNCVMETKAQLGVPAMRMTMDCTQNSQGASVTMTYHVSNMGEVKMNLTATQQATSEAPRTEPPEGANVVGAPELLDF